MGVRIRWRREDFGNEHWQRAYALAYEDYLKNLNSSLAGAVL